MKLITSISDKVNYGVECFDHAVKQISQNPGKIKKVLQFAMKSFNAIDLYQKGIILDREVCHIMKGTCDLIGFYSSYKEITYWIYLFSKQNMDDVQLQRSIEESLKDPEIEKGDSENQKKLAKEIFEEVMTRDEYHSRKEVVQKIRASLIKHGVDDDRAQQVASKVIVQQKTRSPAELFYMACFTTADVSSVILNLQKWNFLELSQIAAQLGNQSPVFMFIIDAGSGMVLGAVASAGLFVLAGKDAHKAISLAMKMHSAGSPEEREKIYKQLCGVLFDVTVDIADLASAATPLFVTLNPPTLIALGLVSKGLGIVCFLSKGH